MRNIVSPLRPRHILLLIVISSLQSGCILLKPFGFFKESDAETEPQMASFYYTIPRPVLTKKQTNLENNKAVSAKQSGPKALPEGHQLKSFLDNIAVWKAKNEKKSQQKEPVKPAEVASIERPSNTSKPAITRSTEQQNFCKKINKRLSSVSLEDCMIINLSKTGHFSTKGSPILLSRFNQPDGIKSAGRVLLLGGVHGDELSSVSVVFEWMQFLRSHHTGKFVWEVVPVMNPDGLFNSKPSRTNANGVDLNRNMPTRDWQGSALSYWRNRAKSSPRKFPGFTSGSELETRWLVNQIDRFKPDMIVSVHAPHNLIDYDAPSRKNAPRRFGNLKGGLLGTFPGSLGNYAGVKRGIPVVTIELPSANKALPPAQAHEMWSDMITWLAKTIPIENERFLPNRRYASLEIN